MSAVELPDAIHGFRSAMAQAGLIPPEVIEADGMLHRFSTNAKAGDDSGWYILHLDHVPAGAFGCWRSGLSETWCARKPSDMSEADREQYRRTIAETQRQRDAERERRHAEARERAAEIWERAKPESGEHRYLWDKGVEPHGIRTDGHQLVIPMRDTEGQLHSLQFIPPDGRNKRFLPGGRVRGLYHAIGRLNGTLCICEGYADGASIYEGAGHAVAVAFTAGNLEAVARAMRAKFPDTRLIICADDDLYTKGNPGLAKATTAALAVGGLLAVPDFGANRPEGATDFNDLAQYSGVEALQRAIAQAKLPPRQRHQPQSDNVAAGAVGVKDADKGLHFTKLTDLLAEPEEEQPWLVEELLPEAGLSMLTARPKSGKSTIARNVSLAVASGKPFLGRHTASGTVFYLALEDKRGELRRQFMALGATDEPVRIYCASAPADGVEQLTDAVMRERPALVIIDPIIRLSRIPDSNDYAKVSAALEPFIAMARESGAHVMLVHHTGRGDRGGVDAPMGSTAFAGSVDTVLVMRRSGRMRTLSSVQRYGTDLDEVVLSMDDTGRISASGTKQEHDKAEATKRLTAYLTDNPGADQQAIREAIEGRWAPVREALADMVKAKTITRVGTGKKGDPYLYFLAAENAMNAGPTLYRDQHYQNPESALSGYNSDSYSGPEKSANEGARSDLRDQKNQAREPECVTALEVDDDAEVFE